MQEADTSGLDDITFEELEESLQGAKNRKATGMDDINIELWKYDGVFLHLRLLHFCNMYWKSCSIPTDWQQAKVLSLFKKGNKNSCENYRGISLLDAVYKILHKF